MSIKKSQAILKRFIDLKFSIWFTLSSENEIMFCDTFNFFSASSFLVPLSSFSFPDLSRKDRGDSASRVDCCSFSVLTILTGSRPGKSSKCLLPSFPSAFARFARFPRSRDHPEGLLAAATTSTVSYGVLFCSKQFEYIYAFIALCAIV